MNFHHHFNKNIKKGDFFPVFPFSNNIFVQQCLCVCANQCVRVRQLVLLGSLLPLRISAEKAAFSRLGKVWMLKGKSRCWKNEPSSVLKYKNKK